METYYYLTTKSAFSTTVPKPDYFVADDIVEMTEEQREFYIANPTASVDEIRECKLVEMMSYTPSLEEYKNMMLEELNTLSILTSVKLIPEHRRANAIMTLSLLNLNSQHNTIYNRTFAEEILNEANRIDSLCREEYYRVNELIENAVTNEEVDKAFNSNQYNTFI